MCSHTADFADVRECSSVSKLLVALRIRSLANGGEHAAEDWGPQVQILSSRRETAGQRPFRTKSEAASLLPCSNGVATAHVLTSPLLLRAAGRRSARWLETWPCTSPVTATKECPSSFETVYSGTPAASTCVANECLRVCRPTPLMPKALAAVLIARSAFLGGRLQSRAPW